MLAQGHGEVTARPFEDAAQHIGGALQAAGDGVGEVEGHEAGVDVLHAVEELLAACQVAMADGAQDVAPQLLRGLAQPVEVGRGVHAQCLRRRQWLATHQRRRGLRLREFLEGVLDVSRVPELRMPLQRGGDLLEETRRGVQRGLGNRGVAAVDRPDRVCRVLHNLARQTQGLFAGPVRALQALSDLAEKGVEISLAVFGAHYRLYLPGRLAASAPMKSSPVISAGCRPRMSRSDSRRDSPWASPC